MEYQVEYTTEEGVEHVKPYGAALKAAKAHAAAMSKKHGVAYVVAGKETGAGAEAAYETLGHVVYAGGSMEEVEGVVQ